MVKVICDRCRETIKTQEIGYISCNGKDGMDGDLKYDNEFEKFHFCQECMDEIKEFIRQTRKPMGSQEKPNGIDTGKIVALKKAGWKVKDIAEEMGLKPRSVTNALYEYNAKMKQMKGMGNGADN